MPARPSHYCGPAAALEALLIERLHTGLLSAVRRAVRRGVAARRIVRLAWVYGLRGYGLLAVTAWARRCERER